MEELIGNLDKNAVPVENSVYDHIIYDSSTVEKPFALALDKDPRVKMFFKIPRHFKIDTPLGICNPDWAVYEELDVLVNGNEEVNQQCAYYCMEKGLLIMVKMT